MNIGSTGASTLNVINGPATVTLGPTTIANGPAFNLQSGIVANLGGITNTNDMLGFTQTGAGTLIVSGPSNFALGGTATITSGTLQVAPAVPPAT